MREAHGSLEDLRSPFFSKKIGKKLVYESRESVVSRFRSEMSKVKVALPPKFQQVIFTMEESQAASIGIQSAYLPYFQDGPDKVEEVWKAKPAFRGSRSRLLKAVKRVQSLVPLNSIRTTSILDAIHAERINPQGISEPGMNWKTSSGLPHTVTPWVPNSAQPDELRRDSQMAYDYIVKHSTEALALLKLGRIVEWWAIAGKRLAQKSDIMKVKRLIEALEKSEPVLWKTFTPNLIRVLRGMLPFCALNDMPVIDHTMQRIGRIAESRGRTVLSGDYSGYDATLAPWLIELAGGITADWVQGGSVWIRALTMSMVQGVNLVTPNRIWKATPSSMKSGSGGTNLLDSIANLIVLYYGDEVGAYQLHNVCVQGDDFVIDASGISPQTMSEVASEFGLEANPDKQLFEPHVIQFLQRTHITGYLGGIASVMRTLGSIMSYERLSYSPNEWGPYADVIRARAQLENTVFSPYFETLVNFVKAGDDYELGRNCSPKELLAKAHQVGVDILQKQFGNLQIKDIPVQEQFSKSAVSGVLAGKVVPPVGSEARFSFAYGSRGLRKA